MNLRPLEERVTIRGESVFPPNCDNLEFHFCKIDFANSCCWVGSSTSDILIWVIVQTSIRGLVIIMGVKDLSLFVTWTMLQFYSAQQNIYNKSCYPIMHNVKSQRNICIQLKCLTLMHPNIYMFNRLMNVNSYNLNYKLNLYQNM